MLDLHKGDPDMTHCYHVQHGPPVPTVSRLWFVTITTTIPAIKRGDTFTMACT